MHVDPLIMEPAIEAAHETLRIHRTAPHVGRSGRQTDHPRLQQAHDHPGEGLEMPTVQPVPMLAQHVHYGSMQTRCTFHLSLPQDERLHLQPKESVILSRGFWKACLSDFCQSIRFCMSNPNVITVETGASRRG
jgi:hypothetical protein